MKCEVGNTHSGFALFYSTVFPFSLVVDRHQSRLDMKGYCVIFE